jgi:hypothetical protein
MKIIIDENYDSAGQLIGTHTIDTADPAWQTTFTAINGNPALQTQAGYSVVHSIPARPIGETRWQKIKADQALVSVADFLHGKVIT